jgi:2-polyprenyl-3-methyl-5-hydroxy-6-metoxy-1,4-benzoquinol methylase
MPSPEPCNACGGALTPAFRVDGYAYGRCERCRTLQLDPLPDPERLLDVYQHDVNWTSARASWLDDPAREVVEAGRRVRLLADAGCVFGRVLEIGPGRGALARAMRGGGAEVWISEASERSREALEAEGFGVADGTTPAGAFDLVLLWGVIEHLARPRAILGQVLERLAPGGKLAIYTEDATSAVARIAGSRWHWLLPPEHVVLYSREGMHSFMEALGLRVVAERARGLQLRSLGITTLGPLAAKRARNAFRNARRRVGTDQTGARSARRGVSILKRLLDSRVPFLPEHRLYVCARPPSGYATGAP